MPSSASSLPIPPEALDLLRAFCDRKDLLDLQSMGEE